MSTKHPQTRSSSPARPGGSGTGRGAARPDSTVHPQRWRASSSKASSVPCPQGWLQSAPPPPVSLKKPPVLPRLHGSGQMEATGWCGSLLSERAVWGSLGQRGAAVGPAVDGIQPNHNGLAGPLDPRVSERSPTTPAFTWLAGTWRRCVEGPAEPGREHRGGEPACTLLSRETSSSSFLWPLQPCSVWSGVSLLIWLNWGEAQRSGPPASSQSLCSRLPHFPIISPLLRVP